MRRTLTSLCSLLFFGLVTCAQDPPKDRPKLKSEAFDQKLVSLLRFRVPLLGVEELRANRQDYFLFDTRAREEYQLSHIPGAAYLGYRDFDLDRLKDVPKDAPIALYCSVGYRSERIGEKLRKAGYTKVFNLYGSVFEWVNRGYPLEDEQGKKVDVIHTYNKNWSQWVDDDAARKVW